MLLSQLKYNSVLPTSSCASDSPDPVIQAIGILVEYRRYLAIPATSASSERYFSGGGLTITKLRNRLNKDTFNKLMCLKSWGVESFEDLVYIQC